MADTWTYTQPTSVDNSALENELGNTNYSHNSGKKWYRSYRSWADYWRDTAAGALTDKYGTPTDPLAQLQQQLYQQYTNLSSTTPYNENYDFSKLINARNMGSGAMLQQRAAGIGVQNAYQPAMDYAQRARQTLIDQSLAAYRPQAYQQNQAYQNNQDQLMEALAKADYETKASIEGAGRSV